jgi:hypothetical protein
MLTISPNGLFNNSKIDIDQYTLLDPTYVSRYLLLAGILETYKYHNGGKKIKVLEVGGSGSILDRFVDIDLTIIDILPNVGKLPNYIRGDALRMTFADAAFDAVISCDVLEHIPEVNREMFLRESARVTKDLMVVAAPFNLSGVRDAEISANNYYKKMTGRDHRWLLEHLLGDLPDLKRAEHVLEKQSLHVDTFSNTSLDNWQLVTRIGFLLSTQGGRTDFVDYLRQINKYYLETMMKSDFSKNGYRTFLIASKKHEIDIKAEQSRENSELINLFSLLTDSMVELL